MINLIMEPPGFAGVLIFHIENTIVATVVT